jgi:hypothetical protein
MKKLILAVLVMATFGVNAGALEKFNKGWENIIKVKEYKIKPVKVGIYSLKCGFTVDHSFIYANIFHKFETIVYRCTNLDRFA